MNPEFHVIIPARYASSRLPGKPLLTLGDRAMIEWVMQAADKSDAVCSVVATDDMRIADAVEQAGGQVVLTSDQHNSGSDRIAEAVELLGLDDDMIVVNVQGDEPDMPPALINQVARLLHEKDRAVMATACSHLDDESQVTDPSVVKVVRDAEDYALYFSRATIPWVRAETSSGLDPQAAQIVMRHLGIYAYRAGYIKQFAATGPAQLELYEKLEQLRVLWRGERIACAEAIEAPGPGIDTEQDLIRARLRF